MLAQKFMIKIAASIVSTLFMLISLLVMTRYVGYEYGVMMGGWALVGLINTISDLGFDTASVKFISQGKDQNTCISTHLFLKSVLVGIMVLITIAYLSVSILAGSISPENTTIIILFMVYYAVADLVWVVIRAFDGRLEAAKSSVIQASDAGMRSLVLIVLALYGSSAAVLSAGYVAGAAFSVLVALYLFRKVGYRPVRPSYLKDYIVYAKPIVVGVLLVAAISFVDKVIVGFFWNSAELGYYTVALGVAYAATAIGVAINYLLLPKFSELFSAGDWDSVKSTLWGAEKYISILFLPAVIFVMVFGDSLVTAVFGTGFSPAGEVLSILSVYIYLYLMVGILTQVLYSTGNNKLYRNATIIFSVSTFALLIALVPNNIGGLELAGMGASGAAVSLAAGYLIYAAAIHCYVKVSTKLSLHKGLARQFLAGAAVFAAAFFIRGMGPFGPLPLMLLLLMCFALFLALLFILKEMNKGDLLFILRTLNPKNAYDRSNDENGR